MKTLIKQCSVLLIITLVFASLVSSYAGEEKQTLYSYVINTYNGNSQVIDKLTKLQQEYDVLSTQNLAAMSYESLREYAVELDESINDDMLTDIENLELNASYIQEQLETGIETLTPKEISALNRELYLTNEELNKLLEAKSDLQSLFTNNSYEYIDTKYLEDSIEELQKMVSYDTGNLSTDIGDLSQLKRPWDTSMYWYKSSSMGMRIHPVTKKLMFHNATDYAMNVGTPLYALFNGKVTSVGPLGTYGNQIKIDCGNGIVVQYAHLSEMAVKVGDTVKQNQYIGKSGNTGRTTGPHLHLGLFIKGEVKDVEKLFHF